MVERRVAVKGGGEVDLDEEKREKRKKREKRGKEGEKEKEDNEAKRKKRTSPVVKVSVFIGL